MQNFFSFIVLFVVIFLLLLIYFISLTGLIHIEHETYVKIISLGIFLAGATWLIVKEAKYFLSESGQQDRSPLQIIIPLIILLISSIFHKNVGVYATFLFVLSTLIYALKERKLYKPNKIYYILFAYVILILMGTIGTKNGFHFPDRIHTLYFLPLSFCFFDLSKKTLLWIARLFFRVMLLFLAVCIVYWWFNFLNLDANFFEWITGKMGFNIDMMNWEAQYAIQKSIHYPAYYFVNSWSYYYHPTYISLVLLFALTIGFYLHYKKENLSKVSTIELTLYLIACFIVLALMESRVGFVGFCILCVATGLYYAKLKTRLFKTVLILYVIAGVLILYFAQNMIAGFLADDVRDSLTKIAISHIKDNFWWGVGSFEEASAIKSQMTMMEGMFPFLRDNINYVHNQFLGNMVQFGIWGLIMLLVLMLGILRFAIKQRSYLLQMFFLIMFVFMLIEEPLYTQPGITRFTIFLTFFVSISDSNIKRKYINFKNIFRKNNDKY